MTSVRPGGILSGFRNPYNPVVASSQQDSNEEYREKKSTIIIESSAQPSNMKLVNELNSSKEKEGEGEMPGEDEEAGLDAEGLLQRASSLLEALDLKEAERLFLLTWRRLVEKPAPTRKPAIQLYSGLAEVCTRTSRTNRQNPLEWQWLCVHAATLLTEAAELCRLEMKVERDNQSLEWYRSQMDWMEERARSLEDVMARTLHNWLKSEWQVVDPRHALARTPLSPAHPLTAAGLLGVQHPTQPGLLKQSLSVESLHDAPLMEDAASGGTNWFKRLQLYTHLRLRNPDWKQVLHQVTTANFSSEELKGTSDPNLDEVAAGSADGATGTVVENGVGPDSTDSAGVTISVTQPDADDGRDSLAKELASSDVDTSGWEFFLDERKQCQLDTLIQVVPWTEDDDDKEDGDEADGEVALDKPIVSPLHEKSLKHTMAQVYHKVVVKLIDEEEFRKAELLCEEILEIVNEIQDGTVRMLRFNASLLQNIGLLCLKQGDISKALENLEKALEIFRDLQCYEANREVALVLIDIGNAYLADDLTPDKLYDCVIVTIREYFEKEAYDDQDAGNNSPEKNNTKKFEQPEETKEEIESKKRVGKAISCFKEALEVLEDKEISRVETLAKALSRLGDCYFRLENWSEALDSYEQAMSLLRRSYSHGKDSVKENAHVLFMLGVSTFMLHVYPRAASVFELAYRMVKHNSYQGDNPQFLHGLLLSLMGITFYKMKAYHRCVAMCYQAFEIFWEMYGEPIVELPRQKFWLVCQGLYILGNSYNVLNLQSKAIKYLNVGRAFMRASKNGEKRQLMRILQILGDCYFAQYDYKTALTYYNEALEDATNEQEGEEEEEQGQDMTDSTQDMALHNQLLSRSADAHISMKQYQNAVTYLEQARDIQDVLEEDIKGDLVSTLHHLGQMHSMAGDVDKAIDSYRESLEVFREMHEGKLGPEMCTTLGNLATMCYVKACICEEIDRELEMILAAEQYFQDALTMEMNQSVCVKYANFLYSQGNYDDAILYLEDALKAASGPSPDILYSGLEKVTLPDPLQDEVDAQEEIVMPSTVLARYILILSHKALGQWRQAERALTEVLYEVHATDSPFLYSVLGYALMELQLYREAALNFALAITLDPLYHLALDNFCYCLGAMVITTLQKAFLNVFIFHRWWYDHDNIQSRLLAITQSDSY